MTCFCGNSIMPQSYLLNSTKHQELLDSFTPVSNYLREVLLLQALLFGREKLRHREIKYFPVSQSVSKSWNLSLQVVWDVPEGYLLQSTMFSNCILVLGYASMLVWKSKCLTSLLKKKSSPPFLPHSQFLLRKGNYFHFKTFFLLVTPSFLLTFLLLFLNIIHTLF